MKTLITDITALSLFLCQETKWIGGGDEGCLLSVTTLGPMRTVDLFVNNCMWVETVTEEAPLCFRFNYVTHVPPYLHFSTSSIQADFSVTNSCLSAEFAFLSELHHSSAPGPALLRIQAPSLLINIMHPSAACVCGCCSVTCWLCVRQSDVRKGVEEPGLWHAMS